MDAKGWIAHSRSDGIYMTREGSSLVFISNAERPMSNSNSRSRHHHPGRKQTECPIPVVSTLNVLHVIWQCPYERVVVCDGIG
jgi:hypothetical protein